VEADRPAIAVLPCDNISPNPEDAFLADGIHEEILVRLSKIRSLTSIGRKSVEWYRDNPRPIRDMAVELGAGFVGECSVRKDAERNQIRLTFQLLDARTGGQVWAENYDRDLTAGSLLEMESDVAEQIAHALRAVLTPEDRAQIETEPTDNLEAYEYFVRGGEYFRALGSGNFVMAVDMLEKAVELDPDYGLAWAALSMAHLRMHFFRARPGALSRAGAALDEAIRLGPDLVETRLAQGYYHYWGSLDYDKALEQFRIVQRRHPNNADALLSIGGIVRRQGEWEEALANFERALELDPRREVFVSVLAETYKRMRRYEDAERYANRLIALNPHNPGFYERKAELYLLWRGGTEGARGVLQEAARRVDPERILADSRILIRIFGDEYAAALDRLTLATPDVGAANYYLARAELSSRRSQSGLARAYYDSARVVLEARVGAEPAAYGRVADKLGVAYAGLGRTDEAIRAAKRALDLFPLSDDALRGAGVLADLAEVYVLVGEHDAAIDQLELLLSIPSLLSVQLLRVDPLWDPLRDHPRFQKLLEDYR
jgi:serine/threonine-protein kinase